MADRCVKLVLNNRGSVLFVILILNWNVYYIEIYTIITRKYIMSNGDIVFILFLAWTKMESNLTFEPSWHKIKKKQGDHSTIILAPLFIRLQIDLIITLSWNSVCTYKSEILKANKRESKAEKKKWLHHLHLLLPNLLFYLFTKPSTSLL